MSKQLHEVTVVRVSVLGSSDEGLGTQTVTIDIGEMNDSQVGQVLAQAFRVALRKAILDYAPKLREMWASQPERFQNGDGP